MTFFMVCGSDFAKATPDKAEPQVLSVNVFLFSLFGVLLYYLA